MKLAFIVAVLAPAIAQARPVTPARYDEVSVTLPAAASVPKGSSILDEEGRPQLLDKWLSVPAVFILADFTCRTLCSPILSMAAASLDKTGLRPGRLNLDLAAPDAAATSLFFSFYLAATGLHGIHVTIGIAVLMVLGLRARAGRYSETYHSPMTVGALYWHFVDLVWVFLFALIYLPGSAP